MESISPDVGTAARLITDYGSGAIHWRPYSADIGQWLGYAPFGFWLVDVLRPRRIVDLCAADNETFLLYCEAVDRLSLKTTCHFAVNEAFGAADHRTETSSKISGRVQCITGSVYEVLKELAGSSVDIMQTDTMQLSICTGTIIDALIARISAAGVFLVRGTRCDTVPPHVSSLLNQLSKRYESLEFVHDGGLRIYCVGSESSEAIKKFFSIAKTRSGRNDLRKIFKRLARPLLQDSGLNSQKSRSVAQDGPSTSSLVGESTESLRTHLEIAHREIGRLTELLLQLNEKHSLPSPSKASQAAEQSSENRRLSEECVRLEQLLGDVEQKERLREQEVIQLTRLVLEKQGVIDGLVAKQKTGSSAKDLPATPRFSRFVKWLKPGSSRRSAKLTADIRMLELSDLFDGEWYAQKYLGGANFKKRSAYHYLSAGANQGNDPSDKFDTEYYLSRNPDVRQAGINPLVHFLKFGRLENRKIKAHQV
jgi:hypothetical protein